MTEAQIFAGRAIVEELLRNEAVTQSVAISAIEWLSESEDEVQFMDCTFDRLPRREQFTREDLADAPNDSRVRSELARRVGRIVAEARGVGRIGF